MSAQPVTHRTGAALVRATAPFAEEDRARTWRALGLTLALLTTAIAFAMLAPWWLAPVGTVLAGLLWVRTFIFFHDAVHGAIFRKDRAGQLVMDIVGILLMSPRSIWRESHDYHHRNNSKLPGTAIGSYPVVTTRTWRRMSASERRKYAMGRHPLNMAFGYITIFFLGMCVAPFLRDRRQHWQCALAPVVHLAIIALVTATLGFKAALAGVIGPHVVACAAGSYLFYAQHNFPSVWLARREEWNYHDAALKSSSFFRMSPVMHFLTGNIGYHHIHHLNHKIPFYRLPEAMAAMPELQSPGETSWSLADVREALSLKLWDPVSGRMVPFPPAGARPGAVHPGAAAEPS